MRKLLGALALLLISPLAWAISPYFYGDRVASGGDLATAMGQVEAKLAKSGFQVIGRHVPTGLPGHGVVIATDKDLLRVIGQMGGASIVGAALRVGVKSDGTVSYMNPDYWYRSYLRKQFRLAEKTLRGVQGRLTRALGGGKPFGGDVAKTDLPEYQYMFGMEGFESDKNLLMEHLEFDDAVKSIQENLAKGVGRTAKVYEIIIPEKQIAVFGVALNDPKEGEGWWVKTIGTENIAALPYEIYVVNNRANALFARYRIALGWPEVGMGTFMRIVEAPGIIRETLMRVAGNTPD
ncbi:MAG: hypothetical protein MUC79_06385 [Thiobacillaceae bacterium]|jgi:hypothetical protein|nr:hypothetical protein [Thiobacillaceae bacterium]